MENINNLTKKIQLLLEDAIFLDKNISFPYPFGRSTAGPFLNKKTIIIQYSKYFVKIPITRDSSASFHLKYNGSHYMVRKAGKEFLNNVVVVPGLYHAPNQAFINLEPRCNFHCLFCQQSILLNEPHLMISTKQIKYLINKALSNKKISAIAFTSGVYPNPSLAVKQMTSMIKYCKKFNCEIPVGTEPYITSSKQIWALKNAGADEIKINIQAANQQISHYICPNFDYTLMMQRLEDAVEIFGRGKVCSNILYGVGESENDILTCICDLATKGIVPTLRRARLTTASKHKIEKYTGKTINSFNSEQVLHLAKQHKYFLKKNNLTTNSFSTMCHSCMCCDIVPFKDI